MDSEKWQGQCIRIINHELRLGEFDLQPFSFLQLCNLMYYVRLLKTIARTSSVWNIAFNKRATKKDEQREMESRFFLCTLVGLLARVNRSPLDEVVFFITRRRITFSFIPRCVTLHETIATDCAMQYQRPGARTLLHADLLSRQIQKYWLLTVATRNSTL